jgi:hypothetical protein
MEKTDLQAVEQKVFRTSIDHGLWDIYLGLLAIAIGVSTLLEDLELGRSTYWFVGMMVIALVFFFVAQKFVVEPRLGKVRFGPQRQASLRVVGAITGLALLVGLAMWWLLTSALHLPNWISLLPVVLWVVMCLAGFSLAAYLLGFWRLYLYGILFALIFTTLELIRVGALRTLPTIAAGLGILASGLVLFARFLRKYPLPPQSPGEEESDGPR